MVFHALSISLVTNMYVYIVQLSSYCTALIWHLYYLQFAKHGHKVN